MCGCRGRYRKDSMGAMNMTAAHMHRRCKHLICTDFMHQKADTCNIRNCVHSADFMKMDLIHRLSMGIGLGRCDQAIYMFHIMLDFIRKLKSGNDGRNVRHAGVMVVTMAMLMIVISVTMLVLVVMVVVFMAMLMIVISAAMFMIMILMAMLVLMNMLVQLGSSMASLMAVLVVVISMAMLMIVVSVTVLMIVVSVTVLMIVVSVTVLMIVVMDIVAFFFLSVYSHGHVGSCDPAFNCGLCLNADVF